MHFLSINHRNHYHNLLKKDQVHAKDIERQALFYVLAGNDDLYEMVNKIYDFSDHLILPEILDSPAMTSGFRGLIRLAFNLYNGNQDEHCSPMELFSPLDRTNRLLALEAIRYRFEIRGK